MLPILRTRRTLRLLAQRQIYPPLVMRSELKLVRDLAQRKHRTEQGRYLVQGPKLVAELLSSGLPVDALYASEAAARRMHLREATILPDHELERIGTLENGNEVVAVVPMPRHVTPGPLQADELVLAFDGISDPGNLGTVLRIADWYGIQRVLLAEGSVDAFNPKCVQASMGAIFRVQVQVVDLAPCLDELRSAGATLYQATMEGRPVFQEELKRPAVLVLGSESHGLSQAVRDLEGTAIAVPRVGAAESLNVAVATAALCTEFLRQALAR